MRRAPLLLLSALAVLVLAGGALAGNGHGNGPKWKDVKEFPHKKRFKVQPPTPAQVQQAAAQAPATPSRTPPIGTSRLYLALNDYTGRYYFKRFTLKGVGRNVEVWVADDLSFPAGDCRNGVRTTVGDAQVQYLIGQFDSNIYPRESAAFSVPPPRDGGDAVLPGLVGLPQDYYAGDGDKILTLVDNVRDDNYYDTDNANGLSYIAGFFSEQLTGLFGRNTMTIDAFDWPHRTGARPPDEPVPGDNCASAPARPYLYEGVFAHEYQHLLESYASPGETSWVDEGLSDYAISVTGYGYPERPITQTGYDSHIQCFQGWLGVQTPANPNPRPASGPENSLTIWGDQGDAEILCDYGAAYSFVLYLADHFGTRFAKALHNDGGVGLAGVQAVLDSQRTGRRVADVIHMWAAAMALDSVLDRAKLRGRPRDRDYQIASLDSTINWDTPEAYASPGAPPNGSDYVRLRDASGRYLAAEGIRSISFDGASTIEPQPVDWRVAADVPGREGNPVLAATYDDSDDDSIVRPAAVPAADPTLRFAAQWNTEQDWDYGFVQVSTDGGATYTTLACTDATGSPADPSIPAVPQIKANLPGFTASSGGWRPQECSLAPYAGRTVLLSFRFMSDPNTRGADPSLPSGFWVDDVTVGSTLVSDGSTLEGWQSATQIHPIPVAGFTVQLVGYSTGSKKQAVIASIPLDASFDGTLSGGALRSAIGNDSDVVAAIVTYDEPTETQQTPARYALRVDGVLQPGG